MEISKYAKSVVLSLLVGDFLRKSLENTWAHKRVGLKTFAWSTPSKFTDYAVPLEDIMMQKNLRLNFSTHASDGQKKFQMFLFFLKFLYYIKCKMSHLMSDYRPLGMSIFFSELIKKHLMIT